jgi:RND family efflux transporter MFP subunit
MIEQSERKVMIAEPEQSTASSHNAAKTGVRVVLIVLVLLLVAGGMSVKRLFNERKTVAAATRESAVLNVSVSKPAQEPTDDALVLPGQLQAYVESPIYARTNGYLRKWYKDIGSPVKQGDLLADIETPEVDQELMQARATRQQVQAQMQLAQISASRWENLLKTDSVSQQETDQQTSGLAQAQANLAAAEANVRRLEQLEGFKHIYAPVAGVLTRRNTDIGALINAGAGQPTQALFTVSKVEVLRVYVSVPQMYAPSIHRGMKAYLHLDEFAGQKFAGTVVRTADAIDPTTRTLLTEVDVPNKNNTLKAGAFAQVSFEVPVKMERLTVPINAMLFRAEGPRIAVVADNKVQLHPVQIGRDFGSKVEILSGLTAKDTIVINPADSLEEGQEVHPRPEKQ